MMMDDNETVRRSCRDWEVLPGLCIVQYVEVVQSRNKPLSVSTTIFSGESGLAGFIGAKDN